MTLLQKKKLPISFEYSDEGGVRKRSLRRKRLQRYKCLKMHVLVNFLCQTE